MTDDETAEVIASAVRCVDSGVDKHVFAVEDAHCGEAKWPAGSRVIRHALIQIVQWLAYLGRGVRETSFKPLGSGPLADLACVFASGGKLSQLFHVERERLRWNDEVSSAARAAAQSYVAKKHRPVMHAHPYGPSGSVKMKGKEFRAVELTALFAAINGVDAKKASTLVEELQGGGEVTIRFGMACDARVFWAAVEKTGVMAEFDEDAR